MKTISKEMRAMNILRAAVDNDFSLLTEYGDIVNTELSHLIGMAEEYLINNTEPTLIHCPVDNVNGQQHVTYCDGHGMQYDCTGEIYNYESVRRLQPGELYIHSHIVNSLGEHIALYIEIE